MDTWEDDLDAVQRDFLEDERRRAIVDLLAQDPGPNKSQIARELEIPLSSVRHHLERLETVDLVVMRKSPRGREVICLLPYQLDLWEHPRTRILFGNSPVREVARAVVDAPGSTASTIGDAVGLSRSGAHRHLNTLRDHDLVDRVRLGPAYHHYPTAILERWAEEMDRRRG